MHCFVYLVAYLYIGITIITFTEYKLVFKEAFTIHPMVESESLALGFQMLYLFTFIFLWVKEYFEIGLRYLCMEQFIAFLTASERVHL